MLEEIKGLIKKQNSYLEAAQLIREDAIGSSLDDSIILGQTMPITESPDDDLELPGAGGSDDQSGEVEMGTEAGDPSEDGKPADDDDSGPDDIPDFENDDASAGADDPEAGSDDNVGPDDTGTDDGGSEPIASDLPGGDVEDEDIENMSTEPESLDGPTEIEDEPIDAGEPMGTPPADAGDPSAVPPVVDDADIANVTLDLGSNTATDVLPVPPASAASAIDSDSIETHVDSGFGAGSGDTGGPAPTGSDVNPMVPSGGPEGTPPVNTPPAANPQDPSAQFTEAITLGGDGGGDDGAITAAGAEGGDDAGSGDGEITTDDGEGENAVTSAIRDKVSDAEGFDDLGGEDLGGASGGGSKEELMKKLSSITKNIEDAKMAVMSSLGG